MKQSDLKQIAQKLEGNNFSVVIAKSKADAVEEVLKLVKPGESVGFGGSMTVAELNLIDLLAARGHKIFWGKPGQKPEETLEIRKASLRADVFIASANAITADGKLMFWESIGNRTAGMTYGPNKIIAVVGINKIVDSEATGWDRMKTYVCPANAKRLKLSTPCVATGKCADCSHAQRICNIRVVLDKRPKFTEYHVVLIPEKLGF